MNKKHLIAAVLISAATPAFADGGVVIPGASLLVQDNLQRTAIHAATDSVGPIKASFANRSGSVSESADYGSISTWGTQKLLSIRDGQSQDDSATYSRWLDTISSVSVDANAYFSFDVVTSLAARQTGFAGSLGGGFADWSVIFDNGSQQARLSGHYVVTDGSKTAPKPFWSITSAGDLSAFYGGIGSGTLIPAGLQSFTIGIPLTAGSAWSMSATTSCGAEQSTYRISDALATKCNVGLKWAGGIAYPTAGGPALDFSFQGSSGYDYASPYDPPVAGASSRSRFAPAVAGVPEPASWALMVGGFGLVGSVARRSRTIAA